MSYRNLGEHFVNFFSFLGLSAPNTLVPYSIFPMCVASSSLFIFRLILFSLWRRPTSVSHLIITSNSSLFLRLKEVINSIAASSAKLLIFTILHHHLPCSSFDPHFQFIPPCQASSSDCPYCFLFFFFSLQLQRSFVHHHQHLHALFLVDAGELLPLLPFDLLRLQLPCFTRLSVVAAVLVKLAKTPSSALVRITIAAARRVTLA